MAELQPWPAPPARHMPRQRSRRRPSSASCRSRPSSAASSYSANNIAKGDFGCSPWQPCIEGGIHGSYSEIGGPQLQPQLGEVGPQCGTRTVPPAPAHPAAFSHKVSTSDIRSLIASSVETSSDPTQRRTTLCPQMRRKGVCRLPSCPFVHEVCRPRKEYKPLWCANAPKSCKTVPCRFLKVLGCCPYADACVYAHAAMDSSGRSRSTAASASGGTGKLETTATADDADATQEGLTSADAPDTERASVKSSRANSPQPPAAGARSMRPVGRVGLTGHKGPVGKQRASKDKTASRELSTDSNDSRD